MQKIRIGVLGGTRGMDFAIHGLAGHPEAEVAAICESFEPLRTRIRAEAGARRLDIACVATFDELLRQDVQAVIVANFANEHAPYAIEALKAGKHVMSEVQPVQTLAEAVALVEAVEASRAVYSYAENYCFFPQYIEMRRRFERGDIGELVSAECDFLNDCSVKWHLLTRGNRDHWRNVVPSTFYCTHSIGPMVSISGLRPTSVMGMETLRLPYMAAHGARSGSAATEIMRMENGAMARSLNGNLKHPWLSRCRLIGTHGTLKSSTIDGGLLHCTIESASGTYTHESVSPPPAPLRPREQSEPPSCAPALAYATDCFIGSILGNPEAQRYNIGIYQALDMALPGLLAYRSILQGGAPVTVPDFRDAAARDAFRNDRACTDPRVAPPGELLPSCSTERTLDVPDSIYQEEAQRYLDALPTLSLGSQ